MTGLCMRCGDAREDWPCAGVLVCQACLDGLPEVHATTSALPRGLYRSALRLGLVGALVLSLATLGTLIWLGGVVLEARGSSLLNLALVGALLGALLGFFIVGFGAELVIQLFLRGLWTRALARELGLPGLEGRLATLRFHRGVLQGAEVGLCCLGERGLLFIGEAGSRFAMSPVEARLEDWGWRGKGLSVPRSKIGGPEAAERLSLSLPGPLREAWRAWEQGL